MYESMARQLSEAKKFADQCSEELQTKTAEADNLRTEIQTISEELLHTKQNLSAQKRVSSSVEAPEDIQRLQEENERLADENARRAEENKQLSGQIAQLEQELKEVLEKSKELEG